MQVYEHTQDSNSVAVIGSGFSSLAAASYLAKAGYDVHVFEKNDQIGGRARQFTWEGFKFDMGPSWYWMPDVFEKFFGDFDKHPSDYYELEKLSPAYQVRFEDDEVIEIGGELSSILNAFEREEKGSSKWLMKFLDKAKENYDIAIKDLVYKPGNSITELINYQTLTRVFSFFNSISSDIKKNIKSKKLQQILEFPVLFLGAKPSQTPAFYSFMNYADFGLGTWHPKGGMYRIVQAMIDLARELGVQFHTNSNVEKILVEDSQARGLRINGQDTYFDVVLSGADYHHTEQLLEEKDRSYSEEYWEKKVFAPSSLLFYLAIDKKIDNLTHHSLFFDADFDAHAETIYDNESWPDDPMFYASFPSKTDPSFAPEGKEAAVILIPIAPGIEDNEDIRSEYFAKIIKRLEKATGQDLKDSILFKRSYCVSDFVADYNSFKGNAYGLANTLLQTAFLRPKIRSKKVEGLFFTGQLTVPGPGVPPSLISGKISAQQIFQTQLHKKHEMAF